MSEIDEMRKRHEQALEDERKKAEDRQKRADEQQKAAAAACAALVGLRGILSELLVGVDGLNAVGAEVKAESELLTFLGITPEMENHVGAFVPQLACFYRGRGLGFRVALQGITVSTVAIMYRQEHGQWAPQPRPTVAVVRKGTRKQLVKPEPKPPAPSPLALNSKEALFRAFKGEFEYLLGLQR